MEKVRGQMKRMRRRFEVPGCLRPKKDMLNLIYTVLDREYEQALVCHGRHQHHHHHHHHHHYHHHILRRQSSCREGNGPKLRSSYARTNCKAARDDCFGDEGTFWSAKEDEFDCCAKEHRGNNLECWNVNLLAEREGPIIRIATFDVAHFSLAPAIPHGHPCCGVSAAPSTASTTAAAAAVAATLAAPGGAFSLELPSTPTHLLSSNSSIFSSKSKSSCSDASSGITSFSNSQASTDSTDTCAILARPLGDSSHSTFRQHSSVYNISKVWRSLSSSSQCVTKSRSGGSSKSRTISPLKPEAVAKLSLNATHHSCGNFFQSKLNPVFGLSSSSSSSSQCLMDSLPSLFSDVMSFTNKGDGYVPLPRNSQHDSAAAAADDKPPLCSPSTSSSRLGLSPCNSGFHTPIHPDLFLSSSGAASPSSSPPMPSSGRNHPPHNSMGCFDSPCTAPSSVNLSACNGGHAPENPRTAQQVGSATTLVVPGQAATILDVLLEVDADIIALQEVRAEEERGMRPLSELADALGMEYAYAESWAPEFGNAVLSRWPIKSASVQQIHDETDHRNVLKVVVDVPMTGELNVYCTQLDHLDEDWRLKQVESFLWSVPSSQPHVLTGNFNSLERSDYSKDRWEEIAQARKQNQKLSPRGDVLKRLLQDKSYKDAKLAMSNGLSSVGMQLKGQGADGTGPHNTRVDYILGSPKLPFDFVPGSYSVVSSRGTSNHDLAVVDLQPHGYS